MGMTTRSKLVAMVLIAGVAPFVTAAGCKRDAAGPSTTLPTDPGTGLLTGKLLRIAMIAKSSSNPSFLSARMGAENRARELSVEVGAPIEINWLTPSQEDARVQAQRILQAVNERVDAILISCSDDKKVSDAIDDAVARGVAVMTFDSDAPSSRRFSYCGMDDFRIGQKVMDEIATVLPNEGKGPAKIAILAGNRNAPNLRKRVEGAISAATHHPHLKIAGTFFHVETPQAASAEVLRVEAANPDIAGWAMMGGWPLYNRTLLSELQVDAGKHRYAIVAVNALPPQLIYVEKGFAPVLLAQPTYLWGVVGVETIVKKLMLKKPVPALIPMELVRVTAANLGTWARQLKAWGFGDVPDEYLRLP
jgi:ribose transport system substrate-binding protein